MKKLLSLITLPLFLSACQENQVQLNGHAYKYELNGTPVLIAFDKNDNRYFGKVVNNYFGSYSQKDGNFTFYLAGSTMMMGPDKDMDSERQWFQLLNQVTAVEKTQTDLILKLEDGKTILLKRTNFPIE